MDSNWKDWAKGGVSEIKAAREVLILDILIENARKKVTEVRRGR